MRKLISFSLAVALILALFAGCGSKRMEGISDRAYELGCAALETADEFISGDLTADEAKSKLESSCLLLNHCDGARDSLVSGEALLLKIAITDKGAGTGTMDTVKERRDKLAGYLGK